MRQRVLEHCTLAVDAVHFGMQPRAPPSSTSHTVLGFVHVAPAVEQPLMQTLCDWTRLQTSGAGQVALVHSSLQ